MISIPANTQIWLPAGKADMRKGFDGLVMLAQTVPVQGPFSGHLFVFRRRHDDLVKVLVGWARHVPLRQAT